MNETAGDLDSLHVAETDADRIVAALDDEAATDGMAPVDPDELVPYGRWFHGDEDPGLRRYLVAPPGGRWTTLLLSATDWDHSYSARLAARLGVAAAYLMLHDGDVFTFQLFDGDRRVCEYVSSPVHFDLPERAAGELEVDLEAVLPYCRDGATVDELRAALTPPGRIDVDGASAFRQTAAILELPPGADRAYREALGDDGLSPRPEFASWRHLAHRQASFELSSDAEAAASSPGSANVLPFRRLPRRP